MNRTTKATGNSRKRKQRPIITFQATDEVKGILRKLCRKKPLGYRSRLINQALRLHAAQISGQ